MSAAREVTHTLPPRPQRRPQYGSDIIVNMLQACGIVYAACNPGASFRGLHDSIVNYGGNHMPELIQCCHEEISVALAHGYAKATGTPMAALIHNCADGSAGTHLCVLRRRPAGRCRTRPACTP